MKLLATKSPAPGAWQRVLQVVGFATHIPPSFCYVRLRWEGAEHVPRDGGAVICPNHASLADGPAVTMPVFLRQRGRMIRYMAGNDQLEGAFGPYLRFFSTFGVSQGSVDMVAFREAISTLEAGHLLGVFPEGGITYDGQIGPFQMGAAWIALSAGVPLIPVTINGAFEVWPRTAKLPRPGPVEVIYHKPIDCANLQHLRHDPEAVAGVAAELRETVLSRYRAPAL